MSSDRLLQRPIFGGVFGNGQYALASMPCVNRGLHAIRYMVVEPRAGAVLSVAEDKVEALAGARRVLAAANDPRPPVAAPPVQFPLWSEEPALEVQPGPPLAHVSRRRRVIFERSGGKCFYCGSVLQLDGKWHVEHQQPRALGGGDDPLNLVAACRLWPPKNLPVGCVSEFRIRSREKNPVGGTRGHHQFGLRVRGRV